MKEQITKQSILDWWNNFETVIQKWDATTDTASGLMVSWRGMNVKSISQEVESELAVVGELVNTLEVEPSARAIVLALVEFWADIQAWAAGCHQDQANTDPSGGRKLWHHLDAIREAVRVKHWPQIEPIQQLVAERVKPEQIARMYGWYLPNGSPDVVKVQREIDNPGSQMNWETWVHPEQRTLDHKTNLLWDAHCKRFNAMPDPATVFDADTYERQRQPTPVPVAPESIEELLSLEGITVQQVADMKQISADEVRRVAADLRIPIDSHVAAIMARASTDRERNLAASLVEKQNQVIASETTTYRELESIEARVWAMSDDGVKPGMILKLLHPENLGLTYEKVILILNSKPKLTVDVGKPAATTITRKAVAEKKEAAGAGL